MEKKREPKKAGTKSTSTNHDAKKAISKKAENDQNSEYEDALIKIRGLSFDDIDESKLEVALLQMANKLPKLLERPDERRPTPNPPIPINLLLSLLDDLEIIRLVLQYHSANNRPLDRSRLNGVGIKKQGFIDRAYEFAQENQVFLPKFLTLEKFSGDFNYFNTLRKFLEMLVQLREFAWNLVIQAADVSYTDALEYYAIVQEGAQRRIDGAESIFAELSKFFSSRGSRQTNGEEPPTQIELERDFKKALRGEIDGEVAVRSVKPKIQAGEREVIDKKFTSSERIKDTKEAEIDE
jgi:hypothetical protein